MNIAVPGAGFICRRVELGLERNVCSYRCDVFKPSTAKASALPRYLRASPDPACASAVAMPTPPPWRARSSRPGLSIASTLMVLSGCDPSTSDKVASASFRWC